MALNILVADDSIVVHEVFAKTFLVANIPVGTVYRAYSGPEALKILEDNWVDLVFTDIHMPGMDGVQLIETLHRKGMMDNAPVVVVSAEGSPLVKEHLFQMGAKGYIQKPFTPDDIAEVVEKVLGVTPCKPS